MFFGQHSFKSDWNDKSFSLSNLTIIFDTLCTGFDEYSEKAKMQLDYYP